MVINEFSMNGSLYDLIQNLDLYHTLVLEAPAFNSYAGNLSLDEISQALSEWVSKGNTLLVSGQVGPMTFTGVSFPDSELGAGNLSVQAEHFDELFEEGDYMLFNSKYTVEPEVNVQDYLMIGNYTNGEVGIARWKYSEGQVHYYGDIKAYYNDGEHNNITQFVDYTLARTALGFCEGLDYDMDYENLVKTQRYVVLDNRILRMVVLLWE